MSATLLEPGQIEAAAGAIPELRLPKLRLFANRARRLHQLAEGHSLGDYLHFAARLAEGQDREAQQLAGVPLPDVETLARCKEYAMPPLAPAGWRRDGQWRALARRLANDLAVDAPTAAQAALQRLQGAPDDWLENQAEHLLDGPFDNLDLACAPVIGAALQVYWRHLAGQLQTGDLARPEHPNLCPVCGGHPVASVVRIGGAADGLRYLHCALCGTEWHVVRAKCSNCDNTRDIAYYTLEGGSEAVQAEACPECHSYLKVMRQDKDPDVDPVADDLASLALDLLVAEQGYDKSGLNFLMIHGVVE